MTTESLRVSINTHLSGHHLSGAMTLVIDAAAIEPQLPGLGRLPESQEILDLKSRYHADITGSLFMIHAFLETIINEFFCDAANGVLVPSNDVDLLKITKLKESWENGTPRTARFSVVEKFEKALELCSGKKLEKGELLCQDIQLISELRNALIHHESEIVSTEINGDKYSSSHKLESTLKTKYKLNPFVAIGNPFFPDKCISLGCACWAIVRSVEFSRDFFSRIGFSQFIESELKPRLNSFNKIAAIHKENERTRFNYSLYPKPAKKIRLPGDIDPIEMIMKFTNDHSWTGER